MSTWTSDNVGIPQGSTLGPLLFLLYVNDLSDNLSSNIKLFADDTSLFSVSIYFFVFECLKKLTDLFIGLLIKLQILLLRITFVTISLKAYYKAFVRPHLKYGYILYDQAFKNSFHETRIFSIQHLPCNDGSNYGHNQIKIISRIWFSTP